MSVSSTLRLEIESTHTKFFTARVIVPAITIDTLYKEASTTQKVNAHTHGFARGATPIGYIETAYKSHILRHLEEFLFKYAVIGFLYQELRDKKLSFSGEPQLKQVYLEQGHDAFFTFEFTVPDPLALRGWKYYSFKSPNRKNYRDLDRQVEHFLKTEEDSSIKAKPHVVHVNDWVCFDACIATKDHKPLLEEFITTLWIRIGNEEVDIPFQEIFCGKQIGDQFYSSHTCLQDYFSSQLDTNYLFSITIKDIVSDSSFSIEDFKTNFRLRTNKEMHKKLIEVFSYRNDISQRRETIEEVFKLLCTHHPISVPPHLVLRRQHALLLSIQENPDYQVYRMQRDFNMKVHQLAEKQMRETMLIDQLAIKESIAASHQDIKNYLNLIKRPRTKEFIYFDLPSTKNNGQEIPLPAELLKHYSLREKTLNYIIYHLTRK